MDAAGRTLLVLGGDEVASLLEVGPMLEALERAFVAFSEGDADVPPRVGARSERGILAAMPGRVRGAGLGVKAISVFPGNRELGRPSHQGLIVLVDPDDGTPLCAMDARHVTEARTAGASAISVRLLAREDARVLAVLGAGAQGAAHLRIVTTARPFGEVRVASRDRERAAALAAGHPGATAVGDFEEAVRGADVVCCCTDAPGPVLRADWLAPGAHVASVGMGGELDEATVRRGRVFVEWRGAVTNPPPAGARELQGLDPGNVTELGEVLAGSRPGRRSRDELTVYKSTGHAVEDLAAAWLVHERAVAEGVGTRVRL